MLNVPRYGSQAYRRPTNSRERKQEAARRRRRERDERAAIEVLVMAQRATGLSTYQRCLITIGVATACWGWP